MNELIAALYIVIIVGLVGLQVRYVQLDKEYSRWGIFIAIVMTVAFTFVMLDLMQFELWVILAGGFAIGFLAKMFFEDLVGSREDRRMAFDESRRKVRDLINEKDL